MLDNLIDELNKELGDEAKLREPKSLRLLKDISKNISTNDTQKEIVDRLEKAIDKLDYVEIENNLKSINKIIKDTEFDNIKIGKQVKRLIEILDKIKIPKSIEINNFPEQKEFPDEIKISNFPEQKEFPKDIKVSNFPKQKDFPKTIKVSNFPKQKDFPKKIEISNFPEQKDFPESIKIDGEVKIEKPKWYNFLKIDTLFDNLSKQLERLSKKQFRITANEHERANRALAVRVVDGEGKFVNSFGSTVGGAGFPAPGIVGLYDSTNTTQINPATEDKQDIIIEYEKRNKFIHSTQFFVNPTYGVNMNIDARFTGSPVIIYDENEGDWTPSAISGTWDFSSTTQAHSGTKSIDATATVNGSIAQLAKGSDIDLSSYTAISGWVYITSWSEPANNQILIYGYKNGAIGTSVDIGDYVDTGNLNTWHKFVIPLSDMNLSSSTIDSIRIQTSTLGVVPDYYLDDIQIEESGSVVYTIEPNDGEWLYIKEFGAYFADEYDCTLADNTVPKLGLTGILGLSTLDNGIIYQYIRNDVVIDTLFFKDLSDYVSVVNADIKQMFYDGTYTWLKVHAKYLEPVILKSENNDKLVAILSDDFSGLDRMRVSAMGYRLING